MFFEINAFPCSTIFEKLIKTIGERCREMQILKHIECDDIEKIKAFRKK
jgi:hypothetical protein